MVVRYISQLWVVFRYKWCFCNRLVVHNNRLWSPWIEAAMMLSRLVVQACCISLLVTKLFFPSFQELQSMTSRKLFFIDLPSLLFLVLNIFIIGIAFAFLPWSSSNCKYYCCFVMTSKTFSLVSPSYFSLQDTDHVSRSLFDQYNACFNRIISHSLHVQ